MKKYVRAMPQMYGFFRTFCTSSCNKDSFCSTPAASFFCRAH